MGLDQSGCIRPKASIRAEALLDKISCDHHLIGCAWPIQKQ